MGRPIGEAGLALIKEFEGCRLEAYKPVSTEVYWTIGWGHYGPDVKEGQTITQAEADAMLAADCQKFADAVDDPRNCPLTGQLNDNQRVRDGRLPKSGRPWPYTISLAGQPSLGWYGAGQRSRRSLIHRCQHRIRCWTIRRPPHTRRA